MADFHMIMDKADACALKQKARLAVNKKTEEARALVQSLPYAYNHPELKEELLCFYLVHELLESLGLHNTVAVFSREASFVSLDSMEYHPVMGMEWFLKSFFMYHKYQGLLPIILTFYKSAHKRVLAQQRRNEKLKENIEEAELEDLLQVASDHVNRSRSMSNIPLPVCRRNSVPSSAACVKSPSPARTRTSTTTPAQCTKSPPPPAPTPVTVPSSICVAPNVSSCERSKSPVDASKSTCKVPTCERRTSATPVQQSSMDIFYPAESSTIMGDSSPSLPNIAGGPSLQNAPVERSSSPNVSANRETSDSGVRQPVDVTDTTVVHDQEAVSASTCKPSCERSRRPSNVMAIDDESSVALLGEHHQSHNKTQRSHCAISSHVAIGRESSVNLLGIPQGIVQEQKSKIQQRPSVTCELPMDLRKHSTPNSSHNQSARGSGCARKCPNDSHQKANQSAAARECPVDVSIRQPAEDHSNARQPVDYEEIVMPEATRGEVSELLNELKTDRSIILPRRTRRGSMPRHHSVNVPAKALERRGAVALTRENLTFHEMLQDKSVREDFRERYLKSVRRVPRADAREEGREQSQREHAGRLASILERDEAEEGDGAVCYGPENRPEGFVEELSDEEDQPSGTCRPADRSQDVAMKAQNDMMERINQFFKRKAPESNSPPANRDRCRCLRCVNKVSGHEETDRMRRFEETRARLRNKKMAFEQKCNRS